MKIDKTYILDPQFHTDRIRGNAIAFIHELKVDEKDKPVEIRIRTKVKTKSEEQRAWFHKCCQTLGDAIGEPMGHIKELVKQRVFGVDVVKIGKKSYVITSSSERDDDGELRSTVDYGRLIDDLYLLAAEAGVALPDPDPRLRRNVKRRPVGQVQPLPDRFQGRVSSNVEAEIPAPNDAYTE